MQSLTPSGCGRLSTINKNSTRFVAPLDGSGMLKNHLFFLLSFLSFFGFFVFFQSGGVAEVLTRHNCLAIVTFAQHLCRVGYVGDACFCGSD